MIVMVDPLARIASRELHAKRGGTCMAATYVPAVLEHVIGLSPSTLCLFGPMMPRACFLAARMPGHGLDLLVSFVLQCY
jgi:hypothetical protein